MASFIHSSNLISALQVAIEARSKAEKQISFCFESNLVAGWKENLQALLNNERLDIIYDKDI